MLKDRITLASLVVLASLRVANAAPAIGAESTAGLLVETVAERRVQQSGNVEYVRADKLRVGDEIFYTLRIRNASANPLPDAVVVKAIPRNTRYVGNTATGPAAVIDFSVDGGSVFGIPEQLSVRAAGGVARAATPDDYTHIRWRLRHPLAAGATALLRFRAVFQ